MNTSLILNKSFLKSKTFALVVSIASAIALPQLFHLTGTLTGIGSLSGETFLPMHLPIILAGFIAGPYVGAMTGFIAPLMSYALSGMPVLTALPFITAEVFTYGLMAGLLKEKPMPSFVKLLAVQLAGRAVRMAFVYAAVYFFSSSLAPAGVYASMLKGIPGIILQWVCVIAAVKLTEKRKAD